MFKPDTQRKAVWQSLCGFRINLTMIWTPDRLMQLLMLYAFPLKKLKRKRMCVAHTQTHFKRKNPLVTNFYCRSIS